MKAQAALVGLRPGPGQRLSASVWRARLRRRLHAALALSLVLVGGYFLWLRDSSLVRVEQVTVTGLTTKDAPRMKAALTAAALRMTTLHVREADLARSVGDYPIVRSVRAEPELPRRLRIHVAEHRLAAVVSAPDGRPLGVAPDGSLLPAVPPRRAVPAIRLARRLAGRRIVDPQALALVAVAAAAPPVLLERLEAIERSPGRGVVASLRGGPEVFFGDASRLGEKWMAATRLLAEPAATSASYLDVRLPQRPAAGPLATQAQAPAEADAGSRAALGRRSTPPPPRAP